MLTWLEEAADARYVRDRRLDPFATSMRDFDDVSPNLLAIKSGSELAVNDSKQRQTDLRAAGLVSDAGDQLTPLGSATIGAWEKYGVATSQKGDELARNLLLVLEAARLKVAIYKEYSDYWADLRSFFDPAELIDNWDALYALNYLDYERSGFAPGMAYRDDSVSVASIEFDLGDYVSAEGGSDKAAQGAQAVENAIQGKVPRGRHRSTFCMALELVASNGEAAPQIFGFGYPIRPRRWTPFSPAETQRLEAILGGYSIAQQNTDAVASEAPTPVAPATEPTPKLTPAQTPPKTLELPKDIDFAAVLTDIPKPEAKAPTNGGGKRSPRKVDHVKKAQSDDAVGKLGEQFAWRYEQWRLREHADLLAKLQHVSQSDDTLGYDIHSFELDGTDRYVEVKATVGPLETRFFLSANEMRCAEDKTNRYVILRVANLLVKPVCCEIRHPFADVTFVPETYRATFGAEVPPDSE